MDSRDPGFGTPQGALPKIPKGKNYLLIIAIDKYTNGLTPLNNAVRDAVTLRDLLWQSFQFEQAQTVQLIDEGATRGNIIKAFDDLASRLTDEDNLVFYFSGHGQWVADVGAGYWIPVDGVREQRYTYLDNVEVQRLLRRASARHIFGMVDSCYSSSLFSTTRGDVALNPNMPPLGKYAIKSRRILTAGQLKPVSDGEPGKHSPFADTLLTQLRFGLSPDFLWSEELSLRVTKAVPFNAENQIPRGEPLQNAGHMGGDFIFLAKNVDIGNVRVAAPSTSVQGVSKRVATNDPQPETTAIPDLPTPETGEDRLDRIRRELKELIVKGNFRKFFSAIERVLKSDSEVNDEMILHQANFNSLQRDSLLLTQEQQSIAMARLRKALLYVVNNLEEEDLS